MNTLIKKIITAFDGVEVSERKICEGAGVAEYVYVNAQVIASFEMNGKTESIVFQNGHGYRGNDYNCPSNLFQVYQPEWISKIENLSDDLDSEDQDDLQAIVDDSNGVLKTVLEIEALRNFINDERPTLAFIGESSDTDDYEIIEDDCGDFVEKTLVLKSEFPEQPKVLVTAKLLADVVEQGYIEVSSGVYLSHRDSIIADQKTWDDEDDSKDFDFGTDEFWLTTSDGVAIKAISEGDEI